MLKDGVKVMMTVGMKVASGGLGEHVAYDGRVEGARGVDVHSDMSESRGRSGAYERSEDGVLKHSAEESEATGEVIPR